MTNPPSASLNVYQPAGQSRWRPVQNVFAMSLGRGSRNCWMWNAEIAPSQSDDREHEDGDRRHPLDEAVAGGAHGHSEASSSCASSGSRCSPRFRSSSRTCVTSSK